MSATRIINTQQLKVNITSSLDLSSDQSYFSAVTRRRSQNSSMYDYQIQLYDLNTLTLRNTTYIYSSYSQQKHPCEILADGHTIAVATKYHIIFYDQMLKMKFKALHNLVDIYDISSSPDSKLVAVVGDNTVLIWDSVSFKNINFPFPIPTARSCRFSPDMKYLGVSSTSFVTLFQIRPLGDTYEFNLVPEYKAEIQDQGATKGFGTFNTFDFNPTNSLEIVIGFGNASPRIYNFQGGNKQFLRLSSEDQPAYMNNFKIVRFMPDGKRVFSSDHLSGVGIWPGEGTKALTYKQNFILLDPKPFEGGKKVLGYLWQNIKVAQIQFSCPGQPSGTFLSGCSCPSGQFWKLSDQACVNCSQNNVNICICGGNETFNPDLARCVYNCQSVPHAIQNMRSDNKQNPCFCERGYNWKNGQCVFDCSNIMFNAGSGPTTQSCACTSGFMWDPLGKLCTCGTGSQLIRQNGILSCQCISNYKLEQSTKKCMPVCPLGIDDRGSCICKQGYQFRIYEDIQQINKQNAKQENVKANKTILSATNGGCVRNCTRTNYTIGLVGVDNCQCSQNMLWNVWNQTNVGCKLDCSKIQNAIEYVNHGNGTQACSCAKYYTWIPFNIECGRNCDTVEYVNKSKYPTTLSCPCINNFQWNEISKKCQINCEHIKYSQSYSLNNSYSCICRQVFQWHNQSKSCVVNCTEIWDANERVGVDTCSCKNSKTFNKTSMTCQAQAAGSAFSKPWVWAVLGIGILFVIIVAVVMAKFCWKFSSEKTNKQHNKKLKKNAQPKLRKRKTKQQQEKIVSSQRASLTKQ